MKTSDINTKPQFYIPNNPTAVEKIKSIVLSKCCDAKLQPLPADSLDLSADAKLQLQAKKIFSKSRKFTINSYNSLSKLEKEVLRSTSLEAKEAAEKSLQVGFKVKEHLDKNYGEGEYVFVCIGTSPSGVARVLEFMGVETKYLPISGLTAFYEDDEYKDFYEEMDEYKKFLDEQGITQAQIEKSDKTYLFFDYTRTGRSLSILGNMMRECFGITSNKVKYKSFDFECYSASAKKIDPEQYAVDYIKKYVEYEEIAKFGGVPHLPIWEISDIEERKNYESLDSKKFNFLIIDSLNRKKLLKQNPKNSNLAF